MHTSFRISAITEPGYNIHDLIQKVYGATDNATINAAVGKDLKELARVNYDVGKAKLKAFTQDEMKILEKMDERFEQNSAYFFSNVTHQIDDMLIG